MPQETAQTSTNGDSTTNSLGYDASTPESILEFANHLVGKTVREIAQPTSIAAFSNPRRKGGIGNLVEHDYFHLELNSDSEPDFRTAKVELKVTPIEHLRNGAIKAGERLVLSMLSFRTPIETDLYQSHVWKKCQLMLLVVYERQRLRTVLDNVFRYVRLFKPPEIDLRIIKQDYDIIANYVVAGRAHELSERLTQYLAACTKGATAASSTRQQYYPLNGCRLPAKGRAFCLKQSYMTCIHRRYLSGNAETGNDTMAIVTRPEELERRNYEDFICGKINAHVGQTVAQLKQAFGIDSTAKNHLSMLAFRMLGVRTNNAEEFVKAGIEVKTIRVEPNETIQEHMSFKTLRLKDLATASWENSPVYERFGETRYLFVVYRKRMNGTYVLQGCKFWGMPYADLMVAKCGWELMKNVLSEGVVFTKSVLSNNAIRISNNLPGLGENPIVHLRPHASKAYYKLTDGTEIGSRSDGDQLPDGQWMPKQCVWLHRKYVYKQIKDLL